MLGQRRCNGTRSRTTGDPPGSSFRRRMKSRVSSKSAGVIFISGHDHPGMDRRAAPLKTILRKIENSAERSPLFHWMCQHHDDLQKAARGRRLQWVSLCADFAADGLTSADGKTITPLIASRTWAKVRLEVARRRALEKPRAEPARVRAPVDWRPPTINAGTSITPRPQPTAVAQAQPIPSTGSLLERPKSAARRIAEVALTKNPRERTPEEKLAILKSDMESRSGR